MPDDRTLRTSIEVTTGSAEENLGRLEKAEGAIGVTAEQAAQQVTVAVQQIEQATVDAAAATQQLADAQANATNAGTELSDAEARAAEGVQHLQEAATETTETIEELGEAGKKAGDDVASGAEHAKRGLDTIKPAADKAKESLSGLGNDAAGAGAKLDESFAQVAPRIKATETAIATLRSAVKDGVISKTAVKDVAVQFELLKQQIIETYGSLQNPAALEARAQYEALGAEIQVLIEQEAQLALVAREAGEAFDIQSGKIPSAGKAVESVTGQYGKLGLQMGLYAGIAAIALGAAEKLANAFDDDAKATEHYKQKVADLAVSFKHATYEAGGEFLNLLGKLGAGEKEETSATVELEHALENLAFGLQNTKEASAGLRAEQQAGLPILERMKSSTEQMKAIGDFYALTLSRGALGQKEWSQVVKESGGTLEGLLAAIERIGPKMGAHAKALKLITDAEAEAIRERQKHIDAIKAEIDELDKEVGQVKRWAEQAGSEVEKRERLIALILRQSKLVHDLDQAHHGTTDSLNKELEIIQKHLKFGDLFSQQLAGEAGILRDLIASTDGLTIAERNRWNGIADALDKFKDLSVKQKDLREQLNKELDELNVLKGASREDLDARVKKIHVLEDEISKTNGLVVAQQATVAIQKVEAATAEKVGESIIKITRASGEAIETHEKLAANFKRVATELVGAQDSAETLATAGDKAGLTLKHLGAESHEAGNRIGDLATKSIAAGTSINNVGDSAGKVAVKVSDAADSADDLTEAGAKTGAALQGASDKSANATKSIGDLATKSGFAGQVIRIIGDNAEITAGKTDDAAQATGHLATATDGAAAAEQEHRTQLQHLAGDLDKVAEVIKGDLLVQLAAANKELETFEKTANRSVQAMNAIRDAANEAAGAVHKMANIGGGAAPEEAPAGATDSGGVKHTSGG